ncbi:hypothetical protein BYT27DRAFT_7263068 [Phlegmacium glaucopus]|nr:hypothetical protein BYT27DRAFT_7263068 [Phlegmacium glaucopus]
MFDKEPIIKYSDFNIPNFPRHLDTSPTSTSTFDIPTSKFNMPSQVLSKPQYSPSLRRKTSFGPTPESLPSNIWDRPLTSSQENEIDHLVELLNDVLEDMRGESARTVWCKVEEVDVPGHRRRQLQTLLRIIPIIPDPLIKTVTLTFILIFITIFLSISTLILVTIATAIPKILFIFIFVIIVF